MGPHEFKNKVSLMKRGSDDKNRALDSEKFYDYKPISSLSD